MSFRALIATSRLVLCATPHGFYLAVKPRRRYYRLAVWQYGLRWHLGRSA